MTTKKITLNSEKRKVIADQFQSFYEDKVKDKLINAKEQYDAMREKAKVAINRVVRFHQPQEDVDTIRSMIQKYNRAGGELYEDNCFYVQRPIMKVDDEGREYEANDEVHVRFDMGRNFARAYYRDELKAKGLNPDFQLSINDDYSKRNPKYYNDESLVNKFLGWNTLRLGLKSYRTFDQAKALADKIGVVLNETMMNESSSLALSIYSPDNLASLLEDKEVMTREQKIAFARKQMQQSVN